MASAKIESPPKTDISSKIDPWETRHAPVRNCVAQAGAFRHLTMNLATNGTVNLPGDVCTSDGAEMEAAGVVVEEDGEEV